MASKRTAAATPQRTGLRWTGAGFFPGLPARDLTGDDLVTFAPEIALLEQAGMLAVLYEEQVDAVVAPPVEETGNA